MNMDFVTEHWALTSFVCYVLFFMLASYVDTTEHYYGWEKFNTYASHGMLVISLIPYVNVAVILLLVVKSVLTLLKDVHESLTD